MEKKKILRRAATIGVAVFVACAVLAVGLWLAKGARRREERQRAEHQAAQLRKEYQAYLDEVAAKIDAGSPDSRVIGEIQARHYRALPQTALYVWATTNDGAFSFGVPADAFGRLNAAYDHHRQLIVRDNYYAGRDAFLRTLLHNHRTIPLRPTKEDADSGHWRQEDWWRFHHENTDPRYDTDKVIVHLSAPLQHGGRTAGNLNLKLVHDRAIDGSDDDLHEPLLVLMAGAALWLWFLLPSWVYIDARERGVPRPLLWALLVLVGNVFALMVYLISRPPAEMRELRCPKCGKALNGNKAGCPYCGADLSSTFCSQCQYPLKPDWAFCPACRTAVDRTVRPAGEPAT